MDIICIFKYSKPCLLCRELKKSVIYQTMSVRGPVNSNEKDCILILAIWCCAKDFRNSTLLESFLQIFTPVLGSREDYMGHEINFLEIEVMWRQTLWMKWLIKLTFHFGLKT